MTGKKTFLTLATTLIASVSLGVGVVVINGVNNSKQLFVSQQIFLLILPSVPIILRRINPGMRFEAAAHW